MLLHIGVGLGRAGEGRPGVRCRGVLGPQSAQSRCNAQDVSCSCAQPATRSRTMQHTAYNIQRVSMHHAAMHRCGDAHAQRSRTRQAALHITTQELSRTHRCWCQARPPASNQPAPIHTSARTHAPPISSRTHAFVRLATRIHLHVSAMHCTAWLPEHTCTRVSLCALSAR